MREISRTAVRQKGVATRQQPLDLGMPSAGFGHAAPSTEVTYLAAVPAAGDEAFLARRAAGHLMRLLRGAPPPPEVIARNERRIEGIKVKRFRRLHPRDTTVRQGIPTTTVARTLVDLAACLDEYELGRAWHRHASSTGQSPPT